jgi:GNAT superfamily N-acetyltransferase
MATDLRCRTQFHDGVPDEVAGWVDAQLDDFNAVHAPLQDVQPFCCEARLNDGTLVGGVIARRWGECAEVQQLFVDEAHRRHGLGRQLMQAVEQHACAHGCRLIYLDTFSFQAPAFYRALGYEVAAEFGGFTQGIRKFVMRKRLA